MSVSRRMQRMSEDQRLTDVIAAIDGANAGDPNRIEVDGPLEPAELVYGRRMSETLARMAPNASEHLRIAARGQHIERWTSPRTRYPAGRAGYLKWRKDLQAFHARRIGQIMAAQGYGADDIARVGALIRKERAQIGRRSATDRGRGLHRVPRALRRRFLGQDRCRQA